MLPATAARTQRLPPAEFFRRLTARLQVLLPAGRKGFQHRRQGRILKIHYGRPEMHFEAWHHLRTGRLEIGLHLEGRPEANQAGFEALRARMVEVKGALPGAELEPWDRGWCRLYQTLPGADLDADLAEEAAGLMAVYVALLQPIVDGMAAASPVSGPSREPKRP